MADVPRDKKKPLGTPTTSREAGQSTEVSLNQVN